MDLSGPGRLWRIYRGRYAEERSRRATRERGRGTTTARGGFQLTLALALGLNLVEAIADPNGAAWKAVRYAAGFALLAFAVWHLCEVLVRHKARRAGQR